MRDANDAGVAFDSRVGEEAEESDGEVGGFPVVGVEEGDVDFDIAQAVEGVGGEGIAAGGDDGEDECALGVHGG